MFPRYQQMNIRECYHVGLSLDMLSQPTLCERHPFSEITNLSDSAPFRHCRDLKPDNIVFVDAAPSPGSAALHKDGRDTHSSSDTDQPHVCLMDFGLSERSSVLGRESVRGYVGSEGFTAPGTWVLSLCMQHLSYVSFKYIC